MQLRLTSLVFLFLTSPAYPQITPQIATTDDGKQVILSPDGTWEYAEERDSKEPQLGPMTRFSGRKRILDMAVSSQGKVYGLVNDGFEVLDVEKRRARSYVFDPKSTIWVSPPFQRSVNRAIDLDDQDNVVILWNARTSTGNHESYVTVFNSGDSVKLDYAAQIVRDFTLGPNGNILILGTLLVDKENLVHEFAASGQWISSYHTWPGRDIKLTGYSSISTVGDSVFVLNGLLSESVYEYQDGVLVKTHELEELPAGQGRWLLSLFSDGQRVYVNALRGDRRPVHEELPTQPHGFLLGNSQSELTTIYPKSGRVEVSMVANHLGECIGFTTDGSFLVLLIGKDPRLGDAFIKVKPSGGP